MPYTIILNFMCVGIYRSVKIEAGDLDPNGPQFSVEIIDTFMKIKHIPKLLLCIIAPWFFMGRAYGKFTGSKPYMHMVVMAILFYGTWILVGLETVHHGLAYVGWTIFIFWAAYGTGIRIAMRTEFDINGGLRFFFFWCNKNEKISLCRQL